jgi:aspartate aminotransferase-like enzyme
VPEATTWKILDRKFREHGLVVGGNYGPLTGKVFRLGHMGHQANMILANKAIEVMEKVFKSL